jgi:hypothetical protein
MGPSVDWESELMDWLSTAAEDDALTWLNAAADRLPSRDVDDARRSVERWLAEASARDATEWLGSGTSDVGLSAWVDSAVRRAVAQSVRDDGEADLRLQLSNDVRQSVEAWVAQRAGEDVTREWVDRQARRRGLSAGAKELESPFAAPLGTDIDAPEETAASIDVDQLAERQLTSDELT